MCHKYPFSGNALSSVKRQKNMLSALKQSFLSKGLKNPDLVTLTFPIRSFVELNLNYLKLHLKTDKERLR
jgi:hypothetical protein